MNLNLSVDQVLTTTRSVRKRLDITKPVPRAVIEECLDIALQAPNGSNRNVWRWLVIDDPKVIAQVGALYATAMREVSAASADYRAGMGNIQGAERMFESAFYLLEIIEKVPMMIVPLVRGRPENQPPVVQANLWGSIIPGIWSLFLALRERGIGAAWTTVSLVREQEIADVLGIPFAKYTQAGLFPVAYTIGTEFKKAWRKPLSEVLSYNKF